MSEHVAQLYQEEEDLVAPLAAFAAGGLAAGEGVVIVSTSSRWTALTEALRGRGVDSHAAVMRGQLRLFGAKVILSSCMSHGVPDRLAFNEAIGGLLALMRMRYRALRVFSGTTDELWRAGKREAAEDIERFWSALVQSQAPDSPMQVLCACPLDSLDGRAYEGALQSICALHTRLLPARDCEAFDDAVSGAIREVLEPQLVGMLHSVSAQIRLPTQMPAGQAVMFWLRQHMPRTAEKVLARARARM